MTQKSKTDIRFRINKETIGAIVRAHVQPPDIKIGTVSGQILAGFSLDNSFSGKTEASGYYCLTYGYDDNVEKFDTGYRSNQ